jgi:hypothetical protein
MDESMSGPMKAEETPRRRLQMLEQAVSVRVDAVAWLAKVGMAPERIADPAARAKLEQSVLAMPATAPARDGSLGFDTLRAIVLDPAYQLK